MSLLSNLAARPNLLAHSNSQSRLYECSPYEVLDVWRRNVLLTDEKRLSEAQKKYYEQSLFFGEQKVQMNSARREVLAKTLAAEMDTAVAQVEERPDFERAIELLVAARWAKQDGVIGPVAGRVADWEARLVTVMGRDEFGLAPDMVFERLARILGESELLSGRPTERESNGEGSTQGSDVLARTKASDKPAAHAPAVGAVRANGYGAASRKGGEALRSGGEGEPKQDVDLTGMASKPARGTTATPVSPFPSGSVDADLERIIASWPKLPAHVKASILMLIGAAEMSRSAGEM